MSSTFSIGEAPHAYARLRQAMAPDPSRWYYTGRWHDNEEYGRGHCACGHEIRYEFIIACRDDARSLVIGSTCIETNVPALIRDGAHQLAGELQTARRKLKRDLAAEKRNLQAEEVLPALKNDYRRLRNWCFQRRSEWLDSGRERREMPQVFFWIEELPKEGETPSKWAAAVRRRHVSVWMKAAQALADHPHQFPAAAPPPLPQQPKLFAQLTGNVQRAAAKCFATNHDGALLVIDHHAQLHAALPPEEAIRRALADLAPGRRRNAYLADTTGELADTYHRLARAGTPVISRTYDGQLVELSDHTRVGLRNTSLSGGPALDIHRLGRPRIVIHIQPRQEP
jgi:hypothetical protein